MSQVIDHHQALFAKLRIRCI